MLRYGLLGMSGYNSANVNEETALAIPVMYAGVKLLADSTASLGWHVMQNVDQGKERAYNHPNYTTLHTSPNPHMTSFMFRQAIVSHAILHGNGYAIIERTGGNRPKHLWLQQPKTVDPVLVNGQIFYSTPSGMIRQDDMIHIAGLSFDGIKGKGVVKVLADQLGVVLDAQRYGAELFANGATIGGILTTDANLTKEQRDQLKAAWHEGGHGRANNHSTKVLGGGMRYERASLSPEEAQFLATRKEGAYEICSILQIPPTLLGLTEKATSWGTGIEQQQIGFLKFCLTPWLKRIEQEVDKKLFRESEKGKYFNSFNVNSLLRADIASQTAHIQSMMDRGVYSINEARNYLDQNTIGEEGNRRFVQHNMTPLDRVDDRLAKEIAPINNTADE